MSNLELNHIIFCSGSRDASARETEAVHDHVLRLPAADPHLVDDLFLRARRPRDNNAGNAFATPLNIFVSRHLLFEKFFIWFL